MTDDERRQLEDVRGELLREFHGHLPTDLVDRRFRQVVADFDEARVRTFVPVLVHRRLRDDLRWDSAARVVTLPE